MGKHIKTQPRARKGALKGIVDSRDCVQMQIAPKIVQRAGQIPYPTT